MHVVAVIVYSKLWVARKFGTIGGGGGDGRKGWTGNRDTGLRVI